MKVKSITPAGKANVYNLEVEGTHSFVIQGGVISHNCADEVRYFCMSRPIAPRLAPEPDKYNESPMAIYLDIPKEDIIAKPRMGRMEVISGKNE